MLGTQMFNGELTKLIQGDRIVWNRKEKTVQLFRPLGNGKFGPIAVQGSEGFLETLNANFDMEESDTLQFMRNALTSSGGVEFLEKNHTLSPARKKGDDVVEWIVFSDDITLEANGERVIMKNGDTIVWSRTENAFVAFHEPRPGVKFPVTLKIAGEDFMCIHGEENGLPHDFAVEVMAKRLSEGLGWFFIPVDFCDPVTDGDTIEWKISGLPEG